MINKNQAVALGGFLVSGAVALYLIQLSGLNDTFLDSSLSMIISYSLTRNMAINFAYLIGGLLLLPLSFAFISAYALVREKLAESSISEDAKHRLKSQGIDWILVAAGALMIPFSLLFIGMSATGAAFGAGLFIAAFLMQYLTMDDAKAYKELRPGRISRQAFGSSMLLLSIIVAAAVFSVVSSDASYSSNGINDMVNSIVKLTVDENTRLQVEAVPGGIQTLTDKVKSTDIIVLLKTYYAHMSAITAFTILEIIAILVAPIAGIYASLMWRFSETEAKGKK